MYFLSGFRYLRYVYMFILEHHQHNRKWQQNPLDVCFFLSKKLFCSAMISEQMMLEWRNFKNYCWKVNPRKHSSWWRRLEDVFSVTFFYLSRRLEDFFKTCSRQNCKTSSWRRFEDILEDVLKTSYEDVLKTSRRSLEDVFGRGLANKS